MPDSPERPDPEQPGPEPTRRPRRDMTREALTFPPRERTTRNNKLIFAIFAGVAIVIVVLALYVTFNTDSREQVLDAFATETAELYNTAAAGSTATAAAIQTIEATTAPALGSQGSPTAAP